ncbi:carbon-nitrogen hydrolase [Chaetomidium leptoderma]|uniref:Carbon-nitrogen hydrolase n=1 Tax=Chaetomidium leptoderma TaxID=669021 RepID=A0AAN6ZX30_9PEZI|nr:carbon-nitrogen hydrolase [Chaetomidium leptoderma]
MARVAVGQLTSTANIAHNLAQCRILVKKATQAGAKALFLPEASDYIAGSGEETISLVKPVHESKFVLGLREEARREKLAIHVGVHEPGLDARKVKNTVLWIDEHGEITQRYQKIHLFDVDIKDGPALKESNSVEPGMKILPPFETPVGKVGSTICFDLRFPEISIALRRLGADIITFPSAFTVPTGKAHWEVLLRSRAIETQSYVIAAAQAGRHNEKRVSYGHSMIVDPWGVVLAELGDKGDEPDIVTAEIDHGLLSKVRTEVPLRRRTDVYPEI